MYKLYYIRLLLILPLLFGACHDKLLNPIPESILTDINAFRSAKDIDLAVLGTYNTYQLRVQSDYELMEAPSDNVYGYYFAVSPGMAEIALLTVSPDNPKLNSFWKASYNGIFRANSVLEHIDNPSDYSASQKEQHIGEVKFMRALYYFDLVRVFGGVPLVTSVIVGEGRDIGKATEQDTYDLIIADLNEAVVNLPDRMVQGRASKAAALALLAKVYVYQKQWDQAKATLEQLLTFNYELVPNYRDLFAIETEENSEVIFAMPYVSGTNGQQLTVNLAPHGGVFEVINSGNRTVRPTWDLHQVFEEGDSRFDVTIKEYQLPYSYKEGDDKIWFPYFNKWIIPTAIATSSGLDIPILRFADMILLYAESLYHLGHRERALEELNKIRERAFGNSFHNYTLDETDTDDKFMDKLLLERRLELAMENNRWFDLVRTDRFMSVLTTIQTEYNPSTQKATSITVNAQPYMKYFPIPYEQIQLADNGVLIQNEGYN